MGGNHTGDTRQVVAARSIVSGVASSGRDVATAEPSDPADVEGEIKRLYRATELAVREGTLLLDQQGNVCRVAKADDLIGVEPHELLGGPPVPAGWRLLDVDSGATVDIADHPGLVALRQGEPVERTLIYVSPGGDVRRIRFVAYPVHDDPEVAVDIVVCDAERRQRLRSSLEAQEQRFRTMAHMLPVAMWEATVTGEVTFVNRAFTEITGLTADETPDLPLLEIVHPDDVIGVMNAASQAPDSGDFDVQYRVMHTDGSYRWAKSRFSLVLDEGGKIIGFVGTIEDIDELWKAERQSSRLADIVEIITDTVAMFEDGKLVYLNSAAIELLERTDPGFAMARSHVFQEQFDLRYQREVMASLKNDGDWHGELWFRDVAGERVDLAVSITGDRLGDGGSTRLVITARDIQDQKARELELTRNARHDPLTGLANRVGLARRIEAVFPAAEATVLYVDIDHFKRINDEHGHAAGDVVLTEIARRLSSVCSHEDLVARVGGDEIVVWATDVRHSTHGSVDALATALIEAVNAEPVVVNDVAIDATVTIGVSSGAGSDGENLIRSADRALYTAKASGRNRWERLDVVAEFSAD